MPILFKVGNIASLTVAEIEQMKKFIELDTILAVQFVDDDGENMIAVGYTPEVVGDESTTPAVVTVIKNGSVVQASVVLGAPVIDGETPFASTTDVEMTAEEGASIFYTTDGSTPTTESTEYTEKVTLSATTTVKAIAVKGTYESPVASKTFTKS